MHEIRAMMVFPKMAPNATIKVYRPNLLTPRIALPFCSNEKKK